MTHKNNVMTTLKMALVLSFAASLVFGLTAIPSLSGNIKQTASATHTPCNSPDTVNPTVSVAMNDNEYQDYAVVVITGSSHDNCGIDYVKVKIVDSTTNAIVSNYQLTEDVSEPESDAYASWYYEFTFPYAGDFDIVAKAVDLSANDAHDTVSDVELDITGCDPDVVKPTVDIDTADEGPFGAHVDFVGTAFDNCWTENSIDWVKVKIFNNSDQSVVSQYQDAGDVAEPPAFEWGNWVYDYTFTQDGEYRLVAKVQDVTGNNNHDEIIITVDVP